MTELSLKEIQKESFSLLLQFKKICEQHKLKYFLFYGTLLGAVRHHGFIPWDDDIDVAMPRNDYEQFVLLFKNNLIHISNLKLMHYTTNKKYIYPIARLCDTRFKLEYHDTLDYGLGLFIDIYPLDNCGDCLKQAKKATKKFKISRYLLSVSALPKYVKSYSRWWNNIIRLPAYYISKIIGSYTLIKYIDRQSQKMNQKYHNYSLNCVWQIYGEKEILENNKISFLTNILFENEEFSVPINHNEILSSIYGNFMKLPPAEQQIGHHDYKAFLIDN